MREEKSITLEDRGKKLVFKVKEMAASELEDWTMRFVILLAAAGSDVPLNEGVEAAIAYLIKHGLGAIGNVDYSKAKPLLDEMLGCCYRILDGMEEKVTPQTCNPYIEDMRTLLRLRLEAFKVNFSFFGRGRQSSTQEKENIINLNAR